MDSVAENQEQMDSPEAGTKNGGSGRVKLVIFAVAVAALIVLFVKFDFQDILTRGLDQVKGLGWIGGAVFVLLYVAACLFLLPGSVLTLGAGAIYGLGYGFVLVSLGSTLGAVAAFVAGRYFARDWISSKIEGNQSFKAIDEAVAAQGWKIVFLTRLTPAVPFNLQNYGYGLTKVPLLHYALASWIGMMPGTLLYVYAGSLGGDAAQGGTTPAQWGLRIVALVATIAVTVLITRTARRALARAVPSEEPESAVQDG